MKVVEICKFVAYCDCDNDHRYVLIIRGVYSLLQVCTRITGMYLLEVCAHYYGCALVSQVHTY